VQPISSGALVLELDTDFDGCMKVVQELSRSPGIYLANSMNSLRIEGQKTLSIEVAQQLGWTVPDWLVIPGGNLGNASAVGRGFVMLKQLGLVDRLPRLAVAQAASANPLFRAVQRGLAAAASDMGGPAAPPFPPCPPPAPGQAHPPAPELASTRRRFTDLVVEPMAAGRTAASAIRIGAPVSAKRALRALEALDGVVEQATEQELSDAAARADRAGAYADPHTGVALAVLEKLVARGTIRRGDRVVVVSTAHGLKFSDFKVGYHAGTLPEVSPRLTNPSVKVAAGLGAVMDAIAERFGGRADR
jgi:threonine synthase